MKLGHNELITGVGSRGTALLTKHIDSAKEKKSEQINNLFFNDHANIYQHMYSQYKKNLFNGKRK